MHTPGIFYTIKRYPKILEGSSMFAWLRKLLERFSQEKVSVVIPVLNEGKTIGKVIELVKSSPNVNDIIVIDDNSEDNTYEEAVNHGARVFKSAVRGKGISMKEGLEYAKNDIIVYIDGDIDNYEDDVIKKLSDPIIHKTCDFVKATFSRDAGRVTELVAKPLLSILFPDLLTFSQPLSGMIASRKKYLQKATFENDYGVDIGILIDVYNNGARIKEVNIGKIDNKSKPWQALGQMSREVSKAILKRAELKKLLDIRDIETINVVENEMTSSVEASIKDKNKIILIDIDGVLCEENFLNKLADRFKFKQELADIVSKNDEPYVAIKKTARLLKDIKVKDVFDILDKIKILPDAKVLVQTLHQKGYLVGIITDYFDIAANYIKNKIGCDFSLANELEIKNHRLTGEVRIPFCFIRNDKSLCSHTVCKSNALRYLSETYGIKISDIVVVGKQASNICLIKLAGLGIAYNAENKEFIAAADKVIKNKNIKEIASLVP